MIVKVKALYDTTSKLSGDYEYEYEYNNGNVAILITNMEHDITIQNCVFIGPWNHAIQLRYGDDANFTTTVGGELIIQDSVFVNVQNGITIQSEDNDEETQQSSEIFKVTVQDCTFNGIAENGKSSRLLSRIVHLMGLLKMVSPWIIYY